MKTIKFKGKHTIFLNGMEYKVYNVGDLPPSFVFFKKHNEEYYKQNTIANR